MAKKAVKKTVKTKGKTMESKAKASTAKSVKEGKVTISSKTKDKLAAVKKKVKAVTRAIKRRSAARKKTSVSGSAKQRASGKTSAEDSLHSTQAAMQKAPIAAFENALIAPQEKVADAKFYVSTQEAMPVEEGGYELPSNYGDNKITLMVRDPWWLFAYWELQEDYVNNKKRELKNSADSARFIMRVYDISYVDFNGNNAHYYYDIDIPYGAEKWYVNTNAPGRTWVAEMGWLGPDGTFVPVVRSNIVMTPLDGPSWITDEEWAIPEELFHKLYGLSIGFGVGLSSADIKEIWSELGKRNIGSGAVSSFALSSFGLFKEREAEKKRKFWMEVHTELILYGATEPDARVYVQGQPIRLRPDGTFSMRFALPDGTQTIPVKGISNDGVDEIVITPVVNKETR